MDREQRLYFRDMFRDARAVALRDAEGFQQILFALERFGTVLTGKQLDLGKYKQRIVEFVCANAPLCDPPTEAQRGLHTNMATLYELVRTARNSALHEGAFARQLTLHSVELATIVEDALTFGMATIGDYAVHHPICASEWHPLSFVRQTMLTNSFSDLPIRVEGGSDSGWRLISDVAVARYLRAPGAPGLKERLQRRVGELIHAEILVPDKPYVCGPDTHMQEALERCCGLPVLVVSSGSEQLIGIATPFDLL